MYITFDYRCPSCGREASKFVKKADKDEQFCQTNCDGDHPTRMIRLPAGTRTTFRYADKKLKR